MLKEHFDKIMKDSWYEFNELIKRQNGAAETIELLRIIERRSEAWFKKEDKRITAALKKPGPVHTIIDLEKL